MKKTKRIYLNNRGYKTVINKNVKNRIVIDEVNPAMVFIKRKSKEYFFEKPVRIVYDDYKNWCEINSVYYSRNMIKNTLEELWELTVKPIWINGKTTRCFREVE